MVPNITLITGSGLNHRYFVNRLNRAFPIESIFVEDVVYPDFTCESRKLQEAWDWFFKRRKEYEEKVFAVSENWERKNEPKIISVPTGQLNSSKTLSTLEALQPEVIILFGSSLIDQKIMDRFPSRILNLHVGISGHYRGSSCNFWPIFDERLEYLGATLLTINSGIDTGEILAQATIEIEESDTEQNLMGKTLILGTDLTIHFIRNQISGKYKALALERNGKLYQKKDFTPEAVLKVKGMVEGGHLASLIKAHLKSKDKTN